jgi:hypothetical protein
MKEPITPIGSVAPRRKFLAASASIAVAASLPAVAIAATTPHANAITSQQRQNPDPKVIAKPRGERLEAAARGRHRDHRWYRQQFVAVGSPTG